MASSGLRGILGYLFKWTSFYLYLSLGSIYILLWAGQLAEYVISLEVTSIPVMECPLCRLAAI